MSRKEEATDDKVVNEYYHMEQIATRNIWVHDPCKAARETSRSSRITSSCGPSKGSPLKDHLTTQLVVGRASAVQDCY